MVVAALAPPFDLILAGHAVYVSDNFAALAETISAASGLATTVLVVALDRGATILDSSFDFYGLMAARGSPSRTSLGGAAGAAVVSAAGDDDGGRLRPRADPHRPDAVGQREGPPLTMHCEPQNM